MNSQGSATPAGAGVVAAERRIGRYQLLSELGAGGMGVVYRARDEGSGRIVALKQLRSLHEGERRSKYEALFEREYHTLVRLNHPRIIDVYDYGRGAEGPYYAMELLEGRDLQQLAPLPYRDACRHLRDVASSLALLHAHRIVHRDLSARNVRLTADGRAKLIDFGVLSTFGPSTHLVGTPPFVAPESVRYMPLDHRTDLYALGAVAYLVLTGRHAFGARRMEELPELWQRLPPRPSELVEGIPPGLDNLVLGLLNVDPMARPASAAAVIDQLTAIAGLEPEDRGSLEQSYLLSSRMVGRDAEQEWVARRVARSLGGKGGALMLDGAPGTGKTRLLYELSLSAQLRGVLVVKADAQSTPGPFGVAIALSTQLLSLAPELAARLGQPHASVLGHLDPELRARLPVRTLAELPADAAERRLRFQTALHGWFLAVSREQPLLLAVDDVHAADDNSATLLAGLGHEARREALMVLVTQRRGETAAAPVPLRLLRQRSGQLKLGALSSAACEELLKSLFGDVANCGRLAKRLFEQSGGNPQQCIELAQLLVRKQIARYSDGMWVLPLEVAPDELPLRAQDLADAKLHALSSEAQRLLESMSIHARPLSLEHCLALYDSSADRRAYALLDELVAEQVLVQEDGSYRFAQEQLRKVVSSRTEAARRAQLHRRAGQALLGGEQPSLSQQIEGAFHLLQAGDEERGAEILARAAREFLRNERGSAGVVEQVVPALVAALEVYERKGRSKYEIAELLFLLLPFSWFVDWRQIARHTEQAISLGLDITGLAHAQALSRRLGPQLGLPLALVLAARRIAPYRKRGLSYDVKQAIASLCGIIPSCAGVPTICLDVAAARRIKRKLAPLRLLARNPVVRAIYSFAEQDELAVTGREREALELIEQNKLLMRDRKVIDGVGEGHWKGLYGGQLYAEAIQRAHCFGHRALELADELQTLGIMAWSMSADQVRLLYHACRGESEEAAHYRERVELFAMQGGTTWQADMLWPTLLFTPDMLASDAVAVRRSAEQLARSAEQVPSLGFYAEAARAAHLCLRGDYVHSIVLYEGLLPQLQPQSRTHWLITRAYFARALNGAGQHARARQLLRQTLAHCPKEDYVLAVYHLEPQRQLALAEAGLRNFTTATGLLDRLLAAHGHEDNALLVGLLHQARAEVALAMGDAASFQRHLDAVEQHFRKTRNPALIASWQQLVERSSRSGLAGIVQRPRASLSPGSFSQPPTGGAWRTLSELSMAADRHEYAVRLLVEKVGARAVYLYLFQNGGMHLAAASHRHEPPRDVEAQLLLEAQRGGEGDPASVVDVHTQYEAARASLPPPPARAQRTKQRELERVAADGELQSAVQAVQEHATVFLPSDPPPEANESGYRIFLLRLPKEEGATVIGGLIVDVAPSAALRIEHQLLAGIAKAIHDPSTSSHL